jgi:hypothetical protein
MPTALMRQCEPVSALHPRVLLGVEALVYNDPPLFEEHRAKDVWFVAYTRNAEQTVCVIEIDP